jgi:hypothetical protein
MWDFFALYDFDIFNLAHIFSLQLYLIFNKLPGCYQFTKLNTNKIHTTS